MTAPASTWVVNRAPRYPDGPAPNGCLWCGAERRGHHRRRVRAAGGQHSWVAPTDAQRLARLRARRALRLARPRVARELP